jgi:hypothetical protein
MGIAPLAATWAACVAILAARAALYENDFQSAEVGRAPQEMLVLDGGFVVREEAGAKFLELPGSPLDPFGVLFGPGGTNNVMVSARVQGTRRGRLFPAFGVGLGGVNGYKLRVSPGKKELELHKGDTDLVSVPFEWQSGQWTYFRLRVREAGAGTSKVEGKVWTEGAVEPETWHITHDDKEPSRPGAGCDLGCAVCGDANPLRRSAARNGRRREPLNR